MQDVLEKLKYTCFEQPTEYIEGQKDLDDLLVFGGVKLIEPNIKTKGIYIDNIFIRLGFKQRNEFKHLSGNDLDKLNTKLYQYKELIPSWTFIYHIRKEKLPRPTWVVTAEVHPSFCHRLCWADDKQLLTLELEAAGAFLGKPTFS